jgi:mobilization protein
LGQSGFSSFYQLLNIRLMIRKMDFSDDRMAEMYRTETPQGGTTKSLFGIIQERVYGRGQRNPYYQRREEAIAFDHQRTPHC